MKRYLKVYFILITKYMKSLTQSKLDFIMGLLGFFVSQISGIVFIYLVFDAIPNLSGWSKNEIIFIYGFAQIPRGIDHIIADNFWFLSSKYISDGSFDKYLLRPFNPLFNVLSERFQADGFGEIIIGVYLIGISLFNLNIKINAIFVYLFIIAILIGAIIYSSIKLFFASLAFWIKDSMSLLNFVYTFAEVSKYPIDIYSTPIKNIVSFVIPFAFVAFYPASYFLGKRDFISSIGLEFIVALVAWFIAYFIFRLGIKNYNSVGN